MLDLMTPLEIFLTVYAAVLTIFALVAVFAPGNLTGPRVDAMREQIKGNGYHV